MARLAADEMIDMVRDGLGGETAETVSNTRILRWLNQSYLDLCSRYRFDQLRTSTTIATTSGTATNELSASDVLQIDEVVDTTNNLRLFPMDAKSYQRFTQGDTSSTGTPIYWFLNGVGSNNRFNVTFYPTPGGTYTIYVYYWKKPAELVVSPAATSPIIPEQWDDSIIHRAISRGWRYLGDTDMSYRWQQAFNESDKNALRSTPYVAWTGVYFGSPIGDALR